MTKTIQEILAQLSPEDLQVINDLLDKNKKQIIKSAIAGILTRNLSHAAGKKVKNIIKPKK